MNKSDIIKAAEEAAGWLAETSGATIGLQYDFAESLVAAAELLKQVEVVERKLEEMRGYMVEFEASEYNPHSGFNRSQYQAAQESTAHWRGYLPVITRGGV